MFSYFKCVTLCIVLLFSTACQSLLSGDCEEGFSTAIISPPLGIGSSDCDSD